MSQKLIGRSADLSRLRNDGYDIKIRNGYLVLEGVPYVNSRREIKMGSLISELTLVGDETATPSTHVALFSGEHPCNKDGSEIVAIKHSDALTRIDDTLTANHTFSNKPGRGYRDYYEKMTTYLSIIVNPARAIDPAVTAASFPVIEESEGESVFKYIDTASSRAGIAAINKKLELERIGIVGLGGTGSYVLDLVAKTPVREIHLFDGDKFLQHNAFRSPGAPSADELKRKQLKVEYLSENYSKMRRGIITHDYFVDSSRLSELREMTFVFISMDASPAKKAIVEGLEAYGIPFIDVGMGLYEANGQLAGTLRVTTSSNAQRKHLSTRVSLAAAEDDEYTQNIQIADLNALNAALAVIKWKKLFGFYVDLEQEHHSTYTINGNAVTNEDLLELPETA